MYYKDERGDFKIVSLVILLILVLGLFVFTIHYDWLEDDRGQTFSLLSGCNGIKTVTFPDGATYVGELKDGIAHGKGTYTFPDGATYVGEWENGKRHGQGTLTDPDGAKYVGEWKDHLMHGYGKFTTADGRVLSGRWVNHEYVGP